MTEVGTVRVRFFDVEVGDKVYDAYYYYPPYKWRPVTGIVSAGNTVSLFLGTSAHSSIDTRTCIVGHPEEGITIKREPYSY
jgi:hypothetical protein